MNSQLIKDIAIWLGIGLVILFVIITGSELLFGDLTNEDSYKPLWVIIPVFTLCVILFRYFWKK